MPLLGVIFLDVLQHYYCAEFLKFNCCLKHTLLLSNLFSTRLRSNFEHELYWLPETTCTIPEIMSHSAIKSPFQNTDYRNELHGIDK